MQPVEEFNESLSSKYGGMQTRFIAWSFDSKPFPNVHIHADVDDRERLVCFTSNIGGMFSMNNNQTNKFHGQRSQISRGAL